MKNEEASYSGPPAHGGTEYTVLDRKAERQHKEDGGSGTAEEDGDDSCAFESGAGTISVLPEPTEA